LDSRTASVACVTIIGMYVTIIGNWLFSRVTFGARLNVCCTGWQSVLHSIHLYGSTSLLAHVIGLDILLRKAQGISGILLVI
jgi:hypothetical protein